MVKIMRMLQTKLYFFKYCVQHLMPKDKIHIYAVMSTPGTQHVLYSLSTIPGENTNPLAAEHQPKCPARKRWREGRPQPTSPDSQGTLRSKQLVGHSTAGEQLLNYIKRNYIVGYASPNFYNARYGVIHLLFLFLSFSQDLKTNRVTFVWDVKYDWYTSSGLCNMVGIGSYNPTNNISYAHESDYSWTTHPLSQLSFILWLDQDTTLR